MPGESSVEREYKFEVDPSFEAPDLSASGSQAEILPEQHLTTTYYDTVGRDLWDGGVTLRIRDDGSGAGKWTLKLPEAEPASQDPEVSVRTEVTWKGRMSDMPDESGATVAGLTGGVALEEVAVLESTRRRWLLRAGGSEEPWAEVDDDLVTVVSGPRQGLRFRQLEVEILASQGSPDQVLEALRAAGARPTGASKFGIAAGLEPHE
ncbi:MAG TPA: CYTH domain-containing protein [Acidimicrobiales bacterium]|nr:CYTH domain-containing protein [Acidimicrobiales bacterium]